MIFSLFVHVLSTGLLILFLVAPSNSVGYTIAEQWQIVACIKLLPKISRNKIKFTYMFEGNSNVILKSKFLLCNIIFLNFLVIPFYPFFLFQIASFLLHSFLFVVNGLFSTIYFICQNFETTNMRISLYQYTYFLATTNRTVYQNHATPVFSVIIVLHQEYNLFIIFKTHYSLGPYFCLKKSQMLVLTR